MNHITKLDELYDRQHAVRVELALVKRLLNRMISDENADVYRDESDKYARICYHADEINNKLHDAVTYYETALDKHY